MRTFTQHLAEGLRDSEFKKLYDEERRLLEIAFKVVDTMKKYRHDRSSSTS